MLTKKDYRIAMFASQDARNFTGIVRSYNRILKKLELEASHRFPGREREAFIKNHPLTKIFIHKLASMARINDYGEIAKCMPIPGKSSICSGPFRPPVPGITVQAFRGKPSGFIGA